MTQPEQEEDLVYEEDQGAALVKKLRTKLKKCEEEKKEYLDGWQRLKADTVNSKREAEALTERKVSHARTEVIRDLLPALDSFDVAFKGSAWDTVEKTWKTGVEHIHTQILQALETHGIERIDAVGVIFDPSIHEAAEKRTVDGSQEGSVIEVVRSGYKTKDEVIRPAQVIVSE